MKSLFAKDPQGKKRKFRLPLNAYLLYLLVATLLFTGVSFSKFASSGSAGDSARVAVMVTSATGALASDDLVVDGNGTDLQYTITVSNVKDGQVAEVGLQYWIVIRVGSDFPTDMLNIQIENAKKDTEMTSETELYFIADNTFAAGQGAEYTHLLTVTLGENATGNYENQQLDIYVLAEQID